VIKVADIAWLEFEKPDLARTEAFVRPSVSRRHGAPPASFNCAAPMRCAVRDRAARAADPIHRCGISGCDEVDVLRIADKLEATARPLPEDNRRPVGRFGGSQRNPGPSGRRHARVAGAARAAGQVLNFGHELQRANDTQRPPRAPARVQRLGHLVLQSTKYQQALNWYLDNLGMIVSDFQYFSGQRERGPTMSFIRCDRGATPADHHTLALALGPANATCTRRIRSATLTPWPPVANTSGARLLAVLGHRQAHPGQSDLRTTARPRRLPGRAFHRRGHVRQHRGAGLGAPHRVGPGPVGPPATKDFLGTDSKSARHELVSMVTALRGSNEFDIKRMIGLLKVPTS